MDTQQALALLNLQSGASSAAVEEAYRAKKNNIEQKRKAAPTDALAQKFAALQNQLDEARVLLLATQQPDTSTRGASLSATKMADLPNAGPVGGEETSFLAPGHLLAGRYEVQEQIGTGGMGAVYRALDRNTSELVALKIMLPSLMRNERARERFLNEARLSQKLSHPNIVNVHDVQHDGELYFLSMELLEGHDLRQLMDTRHVARRPFSEQEARELAVTLAEALTYAHRHTVHRDIKPENIWVTEEGEYKVMDFGIARVQSTSQRTQTGAAMGTAYYMAPEQLKGISTIDGRADQYALGVLLYELLAGEVPAGRFKPLHQLRKDLKKSFAAAVEKALETDPQDRFSDMADFSAALNKQRGGISLPRLPWTGLGIAAVLLLGVIGGGALIGTGGLNVDWKALLPVSAEEKAARKAAIARIQGQVNVLKQRLETSRRSLATEVREAERDNSDQLPALRHWQQVSENAIFSGSAITDVEGDLSMAEALLREEQFDAAEKAYAQVKTKYVTLNETFQAAGKLYLAEQAAKEAAVAWEEVRKKYQVDKTLATEDEIKASHQEADQMLRGGELSAALSRYQQVEHQWLNAAAALSELMDAGMKAAKAQESWEAFTAKYHFTGSSPSAKKAKALLADADQKIRGEDASSALPLYQQAATAWQSAREEPDVVAHVKKIEAQWAAEAAMSPEERGRKFLAANARKPDVVSLPSGLQYKLLRAGSGRKPDETDLVKVNYHGTRIDGSVFDSSYERGKPVSFRITDVIDGWVEGLQLMREGSKFKFFIPPELAYGEKGSGSTIAPNETMVFEVELLEIMDSH